MNFQILGNGFISKEFRNINIHNFKNAAEYICSLPYKRNSNKAVIDIVLKEKCGTCSTKHALLKLLCDENNSNEIKLILGVYCMNATNTTAVGSVLKSYGLSDIPEAHTYLLYKQQRFDFTHQNWNSAAIFNDLIVEIEIQPNQINDFKIAYHKKVISEWLSLNPAIKYAPETLFDIREQCIKAIENEHTFHS